MQLRDLTKITYQVRQHILQMVHTAGSGHTGGPLSVTDILTVLYFSVMMVDPKNPHYSERDRLVLSPAHLAPALYAVLAERGFFEPALLQTLRKFGSPLQGHVQRNLDYGIETTGGSLGQGVGIACGMALAAKLDQQKGGKGYRVYCITSDGEIQEGSVWEAAMFAARFELDNLVFIMDNNNMQLSGSSQKIMPPAVNNLVQKWSSFGWNVQEIDGNDISQLTYTLNKVKLVVGKPTIIIANTVAGKGVSFMENDPSWHGKVPNAEQLAAALRELKHKEDALV